MSAKPKPKTVQERARVEKTHARVEKDVPDVNSEEFKREARRQSLLVANSPTAAEDQAFIDSVASIWQDED